MIGGGIRTGYNGPTWWWFLGSFDATVRLWDYKSQSTKPIQVLEDSRDSVSDLHIRGHEIMTGSVDGRTRLYDLRKGMVFVDSVGRTYIYIPRDPMPPSFMYATSRSDSLT